jgi:hypothetical protein
LRRNAVLGRESHGPLTKGLVPRVPPGVEDADHIGAAVAERQPVEIATSAH